MKHILINQDEFDAMLMEPERNAGLKGGPQPNDYSSTFEAPPIALAGECFKVCFNNEPDTIYYIPK